MYIFLYLTYLLKNNFIPSILLPNLVFVAHAKITACFDYFKINIKIIDFSSFT